MAKNRLDFQAQLSRHSHDTAAGFSSSIAAGMIVPQYYDVLGPGDTVYYQTYLFSRLRDVVTAFRGEIDVHVDYFFVPLQMLFTPFGQIFAQTDDVISSVFNPNSTSDRFPAFSVSGSFPAAVSSLPEGSGSVPTIGDTYPGSTECAGKDIARLLDSLGCNALSILNNTEALAYIRSYIDPTGELRILEQYYRDNFANHPNVSPWLFAAYQAIYQKYYRNDEFERLNVKAYNFDTAYGNSIFFNPNLLRLRYAQRPSDYFTTTRVSPIASAVNRFGGSNDVFPENGGNLNNILSRVNDYLGFSPDTYYYETKESTNGNIFPASAPSQSSASVDSFSSSSVSHSESWYPSAANIRALFAVDKFMRVYGRADKTYDDQILAHFGIEIPHDVKHDLTHLKHYRSVLSTDPIYGTANIQNGDKDFTTVLGQVGGQGMCEINTFNQEPEKFTAPVHGVFMAVAYILTKPSYSLTFDKLNLLTDRLSFPIPEFDKLGAQPLYNFEYNPLFFYAPEDTAIRCGWQNRYQQFKKKFNRVSLNYLDVSRMPGSINSESAPLPSTTNIYAPWQVSRPVFDLNRSQLSFDEKESKFVNPTEFFERADALDVVMVQQFDPDWNAELYKNPSSIFQTDPILLDFFCKAKKVSWMSETGEPDL